MSATPETEMDYLQPDFDPNSITMAKLRGILVAQDVNYPSTAKKGQLVDFFEESVRPKAKKLLTARHRTQRSTRGIVDVPSSMEGSITSNDYDEDQLPARTPQRTSRRTTRTNTEEPTPVPPPSTGRTARLTGSRVARLSEESGAPDIARRTSAGRRTRLSTGSPSVKVEEEDEILPGDEDISHFSTENVFQRGSSPIPEPAMLHGDKRRRTTGGGTQDNNRRSSSRRKTEEVAGNASVASAKRTKPVRVAEPAESEGVEDIEPGEEFTPEEEQAIIRQEEQDGITSRPARRKTPRPRSTIAKIAPLTLTLGLFGGLFTVWRQEKLAVGFCGIGRPALTHIGDIEIPAWAREVILPTCEPCPNHGYCYTDLQVQCEDDFIEVAHPLSLGGIVPVPPTCEPDGEKARKVQAVAERAVEEMRERNAKAECGELRDETTGKKLATAEISEPKLKDTVSSKRSKRMSDDEFEELWHSALGDIMARDEIISDVDSKRSTRNLRSTSLARVPLSCAFRRSLRLALVRYLRELIFALSFIALAFYTYFTFMSRREMESRAKQLAGFAMERLSDQATWANYYGDEVGEDGGRVERYIGVAQLRDDVLRDEFSANRRKKLWDRVQKKVEDNANVRSAVREGRTGEVGRVWEWIGAVGAIDFGDGEEDVRSGSRPSSSGLKRRKSGRMSMGPRYIDSSPIGAQGRVRDQDHATPTGLQHWEEGRPIY